MGWAVLHLRVKLNSHAPQPRVTEKPIPHIRLRSIPRMKINSYNRVPRTVTQTALAVAVTMVGTYDMGMRLAMLVRGLIRHIAPSRGVVAQM